MGPLLAKLLVPPKCSADLLGGFNPPKQILPIWWHHHSRMKKTTFLGESPSLLDQPCGHDPQGAMTATDKEHDAVMLWRPLKTLEKGQCQWRGPAHEMLNFMAIQLQVASCICTLEVKCTDKIQNVVYTCLCSVELFNHLPVMRPSKNAQMIDIWSRQTPQKEFSNTGYPLFFLDSLGLYHYLLPERLANTRPAFAWLVV